MNVRFPIFARLLLVAFLLGSQWAGSAPCAPQAAADESGTVAPCLSNGDSFGLLAIALRAHGEALGSLECSASLPQDVGTSTTGWWEGKLSPKYSPADSNFESCAADRGQTLLLQHTRLQI